MKVRPFHHQRPLAACAILYGMGVVLGAYLPWHPRLILAGMVLCLLAVALLHRLQKRQVLGWMGVFLFLGLFLSGRALHTPLPPPGTYQVKGVVAEEVVLRPNGSAQGYLEQVTAANEDSTLSLGTVYWTFVPDEKTPLLPTDGQMISFTGKVYQPSGRDNPYGFDFSMFLKEKGISCGISGAKEMTVEGWKSRGLPSLMYRCRTFLSGRLEMVFGEESALPRALLLGEKYRLPQDVQDSFSKVGVAHILSVSGMHVAMLAYCVLRLLPRKMSPRLRFLLIGLFLFVYCGMLGFPAPAVRASVFVLLGQYRRIVWRGKDWLSIVAAAFLIILFPSPLSLFSAGFQLSFGAVIGIFVVLPRLEKRFPQLKATRLGQGFLVTMAATLGLAVPTVQYFHAFSLAGLFINPVICLVFMALLPVYALLLLLGCVWLPAAQTLSVPFHILTSSITDFLTWAGDLPFISLRVPHLPWFVVMALVGAFVLLSGFVALPAKPRRITALLLVACCLTVWPLTQCHDVQYIQFSMGQSDAALLCDGRETVIIDAGEYGGDVVSYLQSTGRSADTLILTHLHKDHCLGLEQLLESNVPIGRIILPHGAFDTAIDAQCLNLIKEAERKNIPLFFMHAGQYFETRRCRITACWPVENTVIAGQSANRYSLVLLLEMDGVRLLSCGDTEGDWELYTAADADVIKLAHHGSKDASRDRFLQAVTPSIALVTGNGRSETLPHPETLSRLEKHNISVYNTGETGAVTLTCKDGRVNITPYLANSP